MRAAGTADVEPPAGRTPAAEVITPDTSADAVPDPAGEKTIAAGSPPIEPEPVVAKPPIKKPPSKKPAVKKSKKAKKTQKDPWTKI